MPRETRTITFSLPPEMAAVVEAVRKEEGRTTSELIREALRRYVEERDWRNLLRYGERKAMQHGIAPEDVERLVDEQRAEEAERANRP
jgi:CopG family transcriptional regulator/antitoxin EndoAI